MSKNGCCVGWGKNKSLRQSREVILPLDFDKLQEVLVDLLLGGGNKFFQEILSLGIIFCEVYDQ